MSSRNAQPLDPTRIRAGMRDSIIEGVSFALMVGMSEIYFVADALRLGASTTVVGLIVTLPLFLGSMASLVSLRLLARARSRKPLVVAAAAAQALVLLTQSVLHWRGASTPLTLLVGVGAYGIAGQAGSAAWSSWYGDLVPAIERGRYFSHRNRFIYGFTFLGLLCAGACLTRLEPARGEHGIGGRGFALIYACAGICRLVSTALHTRAPEPRFRGLAPMRRVARFFETRRGFEARRVLVTCSAFYLAVYLASPYFNPYMLETLHFTYAEYTFASGWIVAAKILFLPLWGRGIDQLGARAIYSTAAIGAALVPLPWIWADGLGWVLVGQGLSGASWAGFELGLFSLQLERTYRRVRPHVFAFLGALNGTMQILGAMLGAALVSGFGGDARWVFGLSLLLRLAATAALPRLLGRGERQPARHRVLFQVIGFRPSGGVMLRAMARTGDSRAGDPPAVASSADKGNARKLEERP